jgi:hypothetical protein
MKQQWPLAKERLHGLYTASDQYHLHERSGSPCAKNGTRAECLSRLRRGNRATRHSRIRSALWQRLIS